MMIPDEVSQPILDFIKSNKWSVIIAVSAVIIGLGSIAFFGKDNPIEQEAENIIELEICEKLHLTEINTNKFSWLHLKPTEY